MIDPLKLNAELAGAKGIVPARDTDDLGDLIGEGVPQPDPEAVGFDATLAIGAYHAEPRMVAQRAAFLLAGTSPEPLELEALTAVTFVDLDDEACRQAQAYLDLVGVSEAAYFPDLDALARDIALEFKVEKTR